MPIKNDELKQRKRRLEDGLSAPQQESQQPYTMIRNYLLEAILKHKLNGAEQKLIWWVYRQTYGYYREFIRFQPDRIVHETSYGRKAVDNAYKSLTERNILRLEDDDKKKKRMQVNFKSSTWK
ncbi:MAG: replication protein [Desulfovibrio sp.]|uniref:replication protein n=1 Tax=Desulfovibrio sp. 7SRBS1 TaxID=3378064 RepID=UPI003B407EE9